MFDLSKYNEIIIWGASFPPSEMGGGATSHGRAIESLHRLLADNHYWDKVICIVDSNKSIQGKKRLGLEVKSPQFLLEHKSALVIVNTISIKSIQATMKCMGIENNYVIIPYYFYHGLPDYSYDKNIAKQDVEIHETEIRQLYCLNDPQTQKCLDIVLDMRKKGEDDLYLPQYYEGTGEGTPYFCDPVLAPHGDVTFIDIGAYIGDSFIPTYKFFGENLKKYIAFEPDVNSFHRLQEFMGSYSTALEIELYPYALGSADKEVHFSNAGMTSTICEDGESILEQKAFDNLSKLTSIGDAMIKMDIEGSELDALIGMKEFIKKATPYLAICLYHKECDLYEISHYIKSLNPGYRLYLRGGWHLECWAVPEKHFITSS